MALDKDIKNFLDAFNRNFVPSGDDVNKGRNAYLHFALYHAG